MFYINNYNNNNDITNSEDTHNIVFGHTISPWAIVVHSMLEIDDGSMTPPPYHQRIRSEYNYEFIIIKLSAAATCRQLLSGLRIRNEPL